MKRQNMVTMIAGMFVFISSLLGYLHNEYWLFFTMFVGLNLFQSAITGFCGLDIILKKFGFKN